MIPVKLQPEPPHFFKKVQEPGQKFLAKTPNPTKHWKHHEYWREILDDLDTAYKGICSYSCHWISKDTGFRTVEHFKDKNAHPQDAYQWSNYRFVCGTLNGRKGTSENVLDPFLIEEGWFTLDFPSLLVQPGNHISPSNKRLVEDTIRILGLNDEGTCLHARINWLRDYIQVPFPFPYLEKRAPFLAGELKRLDLIEKIREMMLF